MAGRAKEGIGEPETAARQVAILADDLLVASFRASEKRTRVSGFPDVPASPTTILIFRHQDSKTSYPDIQT